MNRLLYENYLNILRQELIPALGCTEPISIAYACAIARKVLGSFPERIEVDCSGDIIKNVKSVTVPNSGGLKGIEAAAILGVVAGAPEKGLEVLGAVQSEDIEQTKSLLEDGFCHYSLIEGEDGLMIKARLLTREHTSEVVIAGSHTSIQSITLDGQPIEHAEEWAASVVSPATEKTCEAVVIKDDVAAANTAPPPALPDKASLTVKDILEFAECLDLDDVDDLFSRQVAMNSAIADEGLANPYGAQIGSTILSVYGNGISARARARAAAGSDARMSGCPLPVVINSGSGNQGITVSLPVIEYAKEWGVGKDKLYRALAISNLVAIHQKHFIGSLSAYCGAVCASCGAGAAITYLHGGDYEAIGTTIINTIANVGGMFCDGAKPSCAAKIASSVDAAILAHHLSHENRGFLPGEGLVGDDLEETIRSIGYIGRVGMHEADTEILKVMSHEVSPEELTEGL